MRPKSLSNFWDAYQIDSFLILLDFEHDQIHNSQSKFHSGEIAEFTLRICMKQIKLHPAQQADA